MDHQEQCNCTNHLLNVAEELLKVQAVREHWFGANLNNEPAWQILLSLFIAHEKGLTHSLETAVALVSAPGSTARRWIYALEASHFVIVEEEGVEAGSRVGLSEDGLWAMQGYLAALRN